MRARLVAALPLLLLCSLEVGAQAIPGSIWRYYRPSNTGIQGDFNEAVHIGPDDDPWIGGYDPSAEEGGVAKFLQAENRWINISNVDYPVIGHPDLTGTTRVTDIAADAQGDLWLATWRGAWKMDPDIGAASLVNFAAASPELASGGARNVAVAPDGTVWFALIGFGGNLGGVIRHTPATSDWHYWSGGVVSQGGNNWPQLVWLVRRLSIQPQPGGGYIVWADSENSSALVSFDSTTELWTHHEFSFTPGALLDMPGKDCVDAAGNFWARRFAGFSGSTPIYSLDYRTPAGDWIVPAQPPLPAFDPPIWAFRAYGDGEALLADGLSRVWHFDGAVWEDFGVWGAGTASDDLAIDSTGNVWATGTGGAAKRDAVTGLWQRYRITNTSQYDLFNQDLALDPATGDLYACANAGPGAGGVTRFDGSRWTGWNAAEYGLGVSWPFPTDNCEAIAVRAAAGAVALNPMYNGIHQWNGVGWSDLAGMNESRGLVEDSAGRLWSLGLAYQLAFLDGASWTEVASTGAGGNNLRRDPTRPATVWAANVAEITRTDGTYRYSRDYTQFPELNPQSDLFSTVAPAADGIAWLGSTQGLFRLDANAGTYQYFAALGGLSTIGAIPLAVTPDGRLWFNLFDPNGTGPHGLAWFDGHSSGIYSAPRDGGPQWGGLPHAQIADLEVRVVPGGYELWMSCLSRGIAVLFVPTSFFADGFESGDTALWSTTVP